MKLLKLKYAKTEKHIFINIDAVDTIYPFERGENEGTMGILMRSGVTYEVTIPEAVKLINSCTNLWNGKD